MATFLSESEGSDDQGARNNAGGAAVPGGATTLLSSDDEDAPAPQPVESPARVRRGGLRRMAPQPLTVQERSTRTSASSSSSPIGRGQASIPIGRVQASSPIGSRQASSPSGRGQGPVLQASAEDSLRERKLAEQVQSLSSEMHELRQENEDLSQKNAQIQEQVKTKEQSWSQREVKMKASWETERLERDVLTRERLCMGLEDQRAALQREVVQQVHRARTILSHQGSQLVRKSEDLASENIKLEEQAHSQAVKHEKQQELVAELQEAVAHAEDRQAQFQEQAEIASRRYQEAEVAEARSELHSGDHPDLKAEAELRYARDELAQVRFHNQWFDKYFGEMAEARGDKRLSRQVRLCQDSAALLGVLLKQLQGIPQYQLPAEGKPHSMGVKRKAIRALDKQTQKLERANSEWAAHLVEQGLASQEQALSICRGAKREDAQSSFDSVGQRESSQQMAERLRARLQVLCRS